MQVIKIKCDNPSCQNIDDPEDGISVPYGWLHLQGLFIGTGPGISVVICSTACITEAVDAAVEEERQK